MTHIQKLFSNNAPAQRSPSGQVPLVSKVIAQVLGLVSPTKTPEKPLMRQKEHVRAGSIEKASRLHEKVPPVLEGVLPQKGRIETLAGALGHLHGDRILKYSRLEKVQPHLGPKLMREYLKGVDDGLAAKMKQLDEVAAANAECKDLGARSRLSQNVMKSVLDLKAGETFLIPGVGSNGQGLDVSVIYEFAKNQEGSYEVYTYSIAKEDDPFGDTLFSGERHWVRPFMHFTKVPARKLFFSEDPKDSKADLFQAILEMKLQTKVHPEYAMSALLEHLESHYVVSSDQVGDYLSSARSHTDGWRCVKGVLFRYLGKQEYKKFALELKVRSLIEGYQLSQEELSKDTPKAGELRTLLKAGAEGVLRQLAKDHKRGWIEPSRALGYEATALDLLKQVAQCETTVICERKKQTRKVEYQNADQLTNRQKALEAAVQKISQPKEQNPSIHTEACTFEKLKTPTILAQLTRINTRLGQALAGDATRAAEIEHYVGQFTIPKSPTDLKSRWHNVPAHDLPQVIEQMEGLLKHYDKALRSFPIAITRTEANTVFTLYAVIHFLAVRQDSILNPQKKENALSSLATYPLFFAGVHYERDSYLTFFSPEEFTRRKQVGDYFAETGTDKKKSPLFEYNAYWYANEKSVEGNGSYVFFASIVKHHQLSKLYQTNLIGVHEPIFEAANLMKHLSSETPDHVLKKNGLGYLSTLAYASFLTHQFSGYDHLRTDPDGSFNIHVEVDKKFRSIEVKLYAGKKGFRDYRGANESEVPYPNSRSLLPALPVNKGDRFLWKRKIEYPTLHDEVSILQGHKPLNLERGCLEPSFQPHKMVYDAREHIDQFVDPKEQALFELIFFRSIISSKKGFIEKSTGWDRIEYLSKREEWFPLKEQMEQEGLKEACQHLIREGVEVYYEMQVGGRPNVHATLFFLRLATRLSRFTKEPLFDSLPHVQKMLSLKDLTEEERSSLSLHLILAYSGEEKNLTPFDHQEIFKAWIYHRNTPLSAEYKSLALEKEMFRFVQTLQLEKQGAFKMELLQGALSQLGVGELGEEYRLEEASFPTLLVKGPAGAFWELNLHTGEVASEIGILKRGAIPPWIPREEKSQKEKDTLFYEKIFGRRSHIYFQMGSTFCFQDPELGELRVVGSAIEKGLQRKIGSRWTQFISPYDLTGGDLPKSLLADHTHWVTLNGREREILICDFETGKLKAKLTFKGEIHPYNPALNRFDEEKTLYAQEKGSVFEQIDFSPYTLCTAHEGELKQIEMTRFLSQSGETLRFDVKEGKAIFGLNRKFALQEDQPCGLLGKMKHYLVLTHLEEDRQKVLIPCLPITRHHPLTEESELGFPSPDYGELTAPQAGRYTFLEYDLKNGTLIPLTMEGKFQLAYLYLAQREYAKAKELIESVDFRLSFSNLSVKILNGCMKTVEGDWESRDSIPGWDLSPEAAAVALSAYELLQRARTRSKIGHVRIPILSQNLYSRHFQTLPTNLEAKEKVKGHSNSSKFHDFHSVSGAGFRIVAPQLPRPRSSMSPELSPSYDAYMNFRHAVVTTQFMRQPSDRSALEPEMIISYPEGSYQCAPFFRYAYNLARTGTALEREQLRFRLQLMKRYRLDPNNRAYGNHHKEEQYPWKILLFATYHPEKVKPLPDKTDESLRSIEVNWQFLITLCETINQTEEPQKARLKAKEGKTPQVPLFKKTLALEENPEKQSTALELKIASQATLDQGFLKATFEAHLTAQSPKGPLKEKVAFKHTVTEETSFEEKMAKKTIEREFEEFQKGFEDGGKTLRETKRYRVHHLEILQTTLTQKKAALAIDVHNLETTFLELANTPDPDLEPRFRQLLDANVEQEISIKKLIWAFLSSDQKGFKELNTHLATDAFDQKIAETLGFEKTKGIGIEYLHHLVGLYLKVSVYQKRISRALSHTQNVLGTKLNPLEKEVEVQKIAEELSEETLDLYDPSMFPAFLVFEYMSDFAIRPEQVSYLKKMLEVDPSTDKYKNKVIQMMMGGGKTTVLAVILLKLTASRGKLSIFATLSSQYRSVSANLRQTLQDKFYQKMEEIDFPQDQIYANCAEIESRMRGAKKRGEFLVTQAETLQFLQLKFITAVFEAIETKSSRHLTEINTLRRILLMLREDGEILLDEIDSVLDLLKEMHIALGEEKHVAFERIDLIRELFTLFVKEDAQIGEQEHVNLRTFIGLEQGKQTKLSHKDFREVLCRAVTWHFAKGEDDRLGLKDLGEQMHTSFYRYLSGQINPECQKALDAPDMAKKEKLVASLDDQGKRDLHFLEHVKTLSQSKEDLEKQEIAHHIAILKHMMLKVLPPSFQQEANRNFGRKDNQNKTTQRSSQEAKPGFVCPYMGVDTPSSSQFGYSYEWLTFHFMTVLKETIGIKGKQLKDLAALYRQGATDSLKAKRLILDKKTGELMAPEAYEFKKLTGVGLEEIDRPGKVKEALKKVNGSLHAKLILEAQTASSQVVFHEKRVSANGFSLANIANPSGMSGTPYNIHAQEDCLARSFKENSEIEGRIAYQVCERILNEEKKHLHISSAKTPNEVLAEVLDQHPSKESVRMILDSGALFQDYSNLQVAKVLREKTGKPVLFFTRDESKGELTPDSLALLPFESDTVRVIGGTDWAQVEAAGLSLLDFVVFLDQAHTTGTNLKLAVDTIAIMTVDHLMLRRTLFQTILRLRGFFDHQKIEFFINREVLETLPDLEEVKHAQLKELIRALVRSILNQSLRKSDDYYRSRQQKLQSIPEQEFLLQALTEKELTLDDLLKLAPFEPLLIHTLGDSPYQDVGAVEVPVTAVEDLQGIADRQEGLFKGDRRTLDKMNQEAKMAIEKAHKSPWLAQKVLSPSAKDLGMQVQILERVNQKVQEKVQEQTQTQLQLQLELNEYSQGRYFRERDESVWDDPTMEAFLSAQTEGQPFNPGAGQKGLQLQSLPEVLDSFPYQKKYHELFDTRIKATVNWSQACQGLLPIFHSFQRPVEQILVIKTTGGEYQTVLLSQKEATGFKWFLCEQYKQGKHLNVHLVMPDLTPLEDHPKGELPSKEIEDLFLQMNALEGNLSYLESHLEETQKWMQKNPNLSTHFLKLRVESDPYKKKRLAESPLFGGSRVIKMKTLSAKERESILKFDQLQIRQIDEAHKGQLALLSDQQLQLIAPHQVKWLLPFQLPKLRGPSLVQQIPQAHISLVIKAQKHDLSPIQNEWLKKEAPPEKRLEKPKAQVTKTQVKTASAPKKKASPRHDKTEAPMKKASPPSKKKPKALSPKPAITATPHKPKLSRVKKTQGKSGTITQIALAALGAVCLATMAVGMASVVGSHMSWAPRVFVQLSNTLKWPAVGYVLTAAGPTYLFGLGLFLWAQKRKQKAL